MKTFTYYSRCAGHKCCIYTSLLQGYSPPQLSISPPSTVRRPPMNIMMPTRSSRSTNLQERPRMSLPYGPPKVSTRRAATSAASSDAFQSSQGTAAHRKTGEKEAAPMRGQAIRPGGKNMVRSTCDLRGRNEWSAAASSQHPTTDEEENKENPEFPEEDNKDDEKRSQAS